MKWINQHPGEYWPWYTYLLMGFGSVLLAALMRDAIGAVLVFGVFGMLCGLNCGVELMKERFRRKLRIARITLAQRDDIEKALGINHNQ